MTLGDRIKRARKARGLSLEKLAKELGVTRQLVWQWEIGETDPRKHIEALCRVLEVPYEQLYGRASASTPLASKMDRLSPAELAAVEAMVDAFLSQHPNAQPKKKAVK